MAKQLSIVEDDPFGPAKVQLEKAATQLSVSIKNDIKKIFSTAEYQEEVAKPKTKKPKVGFLPFPDKMKELPFTPQIIKGVIPSKSNSYKIITLKSKEGKVWSSLGKTSLMQTYEKSFFAQCDKYRQLGIDKNFLLEVDVYFINNRNDLDGIFKVLLDCLQTNGCIANDSLCYEIRAKKHLDRENPRIEFSLQLL